MITWSRHFSIEASAGRLYSARRRQPQPLDKIDNYLSLGGTSPRRSSTRRRRGMMNRICCGQSSRRISYIFVIIGGRGSGPSWRVQWRVYCTGCGRRNLIHTCCIVCLHKSTTVFDIRSCYVLVRAPSLPAGHDTSSHVDNSRLYILHS